MSARRPGRLVGVTLLAGGALLLFLPGPGIPLILLGLARLGLAAPGRPAGAARRAR